MPARPATPDRERLSVALDATPLLGAPTGVGAFCSGALAALARRSDLDVAAFAVSWRRRKGIEALVPEGVTTRQRAMPARPLHWCWTHASRPPVEWFIGRHDVVHGTNFVVPPSSHSARVVTVHDLTVVLYPELCDASTLAFPAQVRRAVDQGAWVHTPSKFVAGEVVEGFGVDPERVRAVHHGVPSLAEPDGPGPPHRRMTLPEGCSRYVLAVGTVEPRKDYPSLVAAFGEVAAADREVALVLAGADGWGSGELAAAVAAAPPDAQQRIVRTGYLDAVALSAAMRGAALLAYPSRYEGFGFPPLQAMSVGVPVVATAAGAVPEVVGDAAVIVAPGDTGALAAAILRVLGGGSEVDELVARGRRRAAAFSWEACADGLAALYRDAARARGSANSEREAPTPPVRP